MPNVIGGNLKWYSLKYLKLIYSFLNAIQLYVNMLNIFKT